MAKKPRHADDAGFIAEAKNPFLPETVVVVYDAAEQGLDVGAKYAVVCDAHSVISASRSLRDAKFVMEHPDEFCDDCRGLAGSR
jgi:hypothetical protein